MIDDYMTDEDESLSEQNRISETEANNIWAAEQAAAERMANLVGGFDDCEEIQ